jgi:hypothetical protein
LSAFKVLIQKIFPPKETISTVDTTGDGKIDSIQIKFLNLIIPFVVPKEIEIGDFNLKNFDPTNFNISEYGNFFLDDAPVDFPKESFDLERIRDRLLIYHKGESFNINEIMEGKFSGRTIALNDSIRILLKLEEETLERFTEGTHRFRIESDLISNLEIIFELNENNMNIKFDPNNT